MNEIQRVEDEIKILQKKLDLLKEIKEENYKTKSLKQIITNWWEKTFEKFSSQNDWNADVCMEDLLNQIEVYILENHEQSNNN